MNRYWAFTQRSFIVAFAALALSMGLCSTRVSAATAPKSAQTNLVYVGSHGTQIQAMRFDAHTGTLTMIGPVADVPRPTWAVMHPTLPILYSVNESGNDVNKASTVIAFTVNRESGALTKVSEIVAGGGTTHLWLDVPSMTLIAANYSGGSTSSIAINSDGSLGAVVSTVKSIGSGPNKRQASPHAHGVAIDPSGHYALTADLGADRLFVYPFDRATRVLTADDAANPRSFVTPSGSGPRHFAFGKSGRYVYLLTELTADMMTFRWDAHLGRLALVQTLPTSSAEFQGDKSVSEIAVSPDGRFVYAGNRGEHTIVVYRVNANTGELSMVQRVAAGGEYPWSFAIHSSGKWMLIANERSNKVNVFSIDPASGKLTDTGQSVDSPTPVSITFVK